jgi:hypothetical protein
MRSMMRLTLGLLVLLVLSPRISSAQDLTVDETVVDETATEGATSNGATEPVPAPPPAGDEMTPPPPPTPQMVQPTQSDVARLGAWLSSFDGTARVLRYIAAPLGIVAGAGMTAMGIWFIADQEVLIGSREATLGLGTAMIAIGVMSVGIGIYNFAALTYPEDIYARFSVARDGGLNERELGRFEGELLALAEVNKTARYVGIVAGFGLALGGGVAVAVAATEDRDDPRTIGVATGAALAITGALLGALSFIPSPYERAWERYELGLGPDDPPLRAQIAPMISAEVAGMAVVGEF